MTYKNRTRLAYVCIVLSLLATSLVFLRPWRMLPGMDRESIAPFTCAVNVWAESGQSFSPFVRPRIVSSLARVGEVEKALEFAEEMPIGISRAHAYFDILFFVGSEIEPELRREVLLSLFFAAFFSGPFVPAHDSDEVLQGSMAITMLSFAGRSLAQEGLPHLALTSLRLAEDRIQLLPSRRHRFLLPQVAFGHIVLGDVDKGERLLSSAERLIGADPDGPSLCFVWRSIASVAAQAGLTEYVDRYLEKDEDYHRSREERIEGFGASLWATDYIELGDVDRALAMARRNDNTSSRVQDLCNIAGLLLDDGDERGARGLVPEIQSLVTRNQELLNWRAEAAARCVDLLARLEENATARRILALAEEWLADPELKRSRREDALAEVAAAYCRIGECRKAFELLQGVEDDEDVVIALLDIFVHTQKRGRKFAEEELDALGKLCPDVSW